MVLSDEILKLVIAESDATVNYIHRTDTESNAQQIMNEGFLFHETFYKTTDLMINDIVHIRYWLALRKYYGQFVVVFSFNTELIQACSNHLKTYESNITDVFQFLSKMAYDDSSETDEAYILPPQYIKGYFHSELGTVILNPLHDPAFSPTVVKI